MRKDKVRSANRWGKWAPQKGEGTGVMFVLVLPPCLQHSREDLMLSQCRVTGRSEATLSYKSPTLVYVHAHSGAERSAGKDEDSAADVNAWGTWTEAEGEGLGVAPF